MLTQSREAQEARDSQMTNSFTATEYNTAQVENAEIDNDTFDMITMHNDAERMNDAFGACVTASAIPSVAIALASAFTGIDVASHVDDAIYNEAHTMNDAFNAMRREMIIYARSTKSENDADVQKLRMYNEDDAMNFDHDYARAQAMNEAFIENELVTGTSIACVASVADGESDDSGQIDIGTYVLALQRAVYDRAVYENEKIPRTRRCTRN